MRILLLLALAALTACSQSDSTELTRVDYSDMPGWRRDHQDEALAVFVNSCAVNARRAARWQSKLEGPVGEARAWNNACDSAAALDAPTHDEARQFFEQHFTPFRVTTGREPRGQITGYYEPLLHGSKVRQGAFQTPVYGVPRGNKHVSRAQIEAGALRGRAPILLYVDDPVMLFFLHIQGSGKVRLADGSMVGLQYAEQNGFPYVAIGKVLRDNGDLQEVTMQTIRDWLRDNPSKASEVMNQNPSYVYFRLTPGDAYAKGALGISLTPGRSIAVDDDRAAYGVPTYIATTKMNFFTGYPEKYQRLFVSQDTGGALHGPHRADIFFGRGEEEEWEAGHQNTRGKTFWLLPNGASSVGISLPGL